MAPTARDALAVFSKGGIDAIFLDYRLPDLSGLDVLRRFGLSPTLMRPCGHAHRLRQRRQYHRGHPARVFDHLAKPVSRDTIARTVIDALRSHHGGPAARETGKREGFIVHSEAMREVVKLIGRAAQAMRPSSSRRDRNR